jgi:hypothetical protein
MNEDDRKKLDEILNLLQGLSLENKGIRRHISTASDLHEDVLKDVTRMVREIRNRK